MNSHRLCRPAQLVIAAVLPFVCLAPPARAQNAVVAPAPTPTYSGGRATVTLPGNGRVMRGTDFIGTAVKSADDVLVGKVVDYAFSAAQPRLEFFLVMTGGVLHVGGEVRAVPAVAFFIAGREARIPLTHDQFLATPVLTGRRADYLSNAQNLARINAPYQLTPGDGAPTAPRYLVFSALQRANAYSDQNGMLGFIDDIWMSLTPDRELFVEITPMFNPFEVASTERYAIPLARLHEAARDQFTFAVTVQDLTTATIAEQPAGMLASGKSRIFRLGASGFASR